VNVRERQVRVCTGVVDSRCGVSGRLHVWSWTGRRAGEG
jgi:hypothetical protein